MCSVDGNLCLNDRLVVELLIHLELNHEDDSDDSKHKGDDEEASEADRILQHANKDGTTH